MVDRTNSDEWRTLDKDLNRISRVEHATLYVSRPLIGAGVSLVFVVLATLGAAIMFEWEPGTLVVALAAACGAYMALTIGANDVANNMGPAVGANALTLGGAIALAAICETAGALLAGADVVSTISKDIIDPAGLSDVAILTWAMMAALLAAAMWVTVATWVGAPVSTTHSVVGGVVGAGVAAAGFSAVNWQTMGAITAGWLVSPVLGGVIAATCLAFIESRILRVDDKLEAARRWVPVLIGIMAGAFAAYLALRGLEAVVDVGLGRALLIGCATAAASYALALPAMRLQSKGMSNRNRSIKALFSFPLVVSAGLLSFAHGANDVANAIGPLAAIVDAQQHGSVAVRVPVPVWVMVIGALGISVGLALFGPRLIRMVGSQITKLNPMRAYCVALSTAITVILAAWIGLPVSSTHVAVGSVFGVGFFREWYLQRRTQRPSDVGSRAYPVEERRRRKLVRRSHFMTIVAAWIVTVPAAALLAAALYTLLRTLTG